MRARLWSLIAVLVLFGGVSSGAVAQTQEQDKSWDVDVYDDGVDVQYNDDGYDEVNVYDHQSDYDRGAYGDENRYNDSSYDRYPRGGYDSDYGFYANANPYPGSYDYARPYASGYSGGANVVIRVDSARPYRSRYGHSGYRGAAVQHRAYGGYRSGHSDHHRRW